MIGLIHGIDWAIVVKIWKHCMPLELTLWHQVRNYLSHGADEGKFGESESDGFRESDIWYT